jgi:hypothetical protein
MIPANEKPKGGLCTGCGSGDRATPRRLIAKTRSQEALQMFPFGSTFMHA